MKAANQEFESEGRSKKEVSVKLPVKARAVNAANQAIAWADRASLVIRGESEDGLREPNINIARGPIVFGLWCFAVVFGIFGLWAALAPLQSAAVAPGVIVVDSNKKTIQHLEGGIIEEILVQEGVSVEANQPLVKMSETAAKARLELITGQYYAELATTARLIAERDNKESIEFPPELANSEDPKVKALIDSQTRLFVTRRDASKGQVEVLRQRIEQSKKEIIGLKAQVTAANDQIRLITEEESGVRKLLAKGNALKTRLLALQRGKADLEGQRGEYLAMISRAEQSISQSEVEIINSQNEYMKDVVDRLRETQERSAQLLEQRHASADIMNRLVIVAPQSGVVTDLQFHTKGGVIKPGDKIMDLVPQNERLLVQAKILPQDIDVVHQGLEARVRLLAYKSRKTPPVTGKVVYVSADRFVDEYSGTGYFLARVEIDEKELKKMQDVELYPGMPADVLIVTGSRTLLSYLLAPLTESFYLAFREE